MTPDEFSDLITNIPDGPVPPTEAASLEEASRQWPFSPVPLIARLKAANDADSLRRLREGIALKASSPRTMAYAGCGEAWASFYPPRPQEAPRRTDDVIDLFLNTYGSCTPEEEKMLERMIFNPTPDYAEMLAREEQENLPAEDPALAPDSQEARINAFILSQHPAAHKEPEPEEKTAQADEEESKPVERPHHADDSLLSESLARIFIKQGRYERAYEIISGLNLKFPKKSAYFADQLRFLQKLIINRQRLEAEKAADAKQK